MMTDRNKVTDAISSDSTDAATGAALALLADASIAVQMVSDTNGRDFVIRRSDFVVEQITPPNKADVFMPKNVKASPRLQTTASLIAYLRRFKNNHSVVFADIKTDTLVGIIDHHLEAASEENTARLCEHVVTLALPKSEEWAKWIGANERLMSHTDFASFLEENAFDVVEPAGADLLELCRDLQVKQDMSFSSSIRMGDAVSISYSKDEDATTKQNMTLPVSFTIRIPVYFGEAAVDLTCFMRRKISDGKLMLGYKIIRHEATRQKEFNRVAMDVEIGAPVTTIYGTPK
jgi:uncharacterized protein YfdQ (DUF2303 family)